VPFANRSDTTRVALVPETAIDERRRSRHWISFGAHLFVSVVLLLLPGIEDRVLAALIPVTAFVVGTTLPVPTQWRSAGQVAVNAGGLIAVTVVAPSVWVLSMIVITALASARRSSASSQRGSSALINAVAVFAIGIIGVLNDQDFALAAMLISLAVSFAVRRQFEVMVHKVDIIRSELDTLYSSIGVAVAASDRHSGIDSWVSPSIERLTGWTADEWTTKVQPDLIHPDDLADYWIPEAAFRAGDEYQRTARFGTKDGGWVWLRARTRVLEDDDGELVLRGHYEDATEIVASQRELERHASEDNLTGLANRRTLMAALSERLEAERSFGLLLIDADRFKEINDTLGHGIGDEALVALARRISSAAPGHLTYRIGGDEFAVVVDEADQVDKVAIAISGATDRPVRIRDLVLPLEVSIGSVTAPEDGERVNELLSRCDSAMYSAKSLRQRYVQFGQDHEQRSAERLQLVSEISAAVANGEIELHFQSQHDLHSGAVVSYEGLARWNHHDLGLLQPGDFLASVAVSHFARDFAISTVDQAGAFAAALGAKGTPMPVAVNVSMVALLDTGFVPNVRAAIDRHGIRADHLILELTEDEMMDEGQATLASIHSLAKLGVRLSIDDFGTGHSSLERLIDLPIHQIKIDRRFISSPSAGAKERVVTKAVIELGRQLGLEVVAEGIETEAQRDQLIANGCIVGQGFLFGKAVTAQDAMAQISRFAPASTKATTLKSIDAAGAK